MTKDCYPKYIKNTYKSINNNNNKMANDLNRCFPIDKLHIKRYSSSLTNRGNQIEAIVSYHFLYTRLANVKNNDQVLVRKQYTYYTAMAEWKLT